MTVLDIVQQVAISKRMVVAKTVKVPAEDAYNANQVKHICSGGVLMLPRQVATFNVPSSTGTSVQRVECALWNCPNCYKTYYYVNKESVGV